MRQALAIGLLILAGCTRHPPPAPALAPVGAPWPAGDAHGPVAFELALYPTSEGAEDPVMVLARRAQAFPRLHRSNAQDAELPAFWAATVDAANYGPPLDSPALVAHLAPPDRARLAGVKRVTFVTFRGAAGDEALLREALELVHGTGQEIGAFVLDSETGELFTPAALAQLRIDGNAPAHPDLARQVVVRLEGARVVTAGMGKLGLPDVAVEDPRVQRQPDLAHALLDLACQRLRDRGGSGRAGALELGEVPPALEPLLGKAHELPAKVGARRETDAQNRLIQLSLPGGP